MCFLSFEFDVCVCDLITVSVCNQQSPETLISNVTYAMHDPATRFKPDKSTKNMHGIQTLQNGASVEQRSPGGWIS